MTDCGKKIYRSYLHAAWDAKELRRKGESAEFPYRCRKCQGWHVGARHIGKIEREEIKRGQHYQ